MSHSEDLKRAEAVDWFLRLRDPATADWDGFMDWLERDPAHNAIYETLALADADYAPIRQENVAPAPVPSNDNPVEERRTLKRFAGWSFAVTALIAAVSYPLLNSAPVTYAVETRPGQHDMIRLDDGSQIELNGDSRISLRKGDNRFAALDRGEATFTVTHDPKNPFTVHVGDDQIQDVGTVFNIVRDGDMVETAVASGEVLYNPGREAVRVVAGHQLRTSAGSMALTAIKPSQVAAWRDNKLVYNDAQLSQIATDLSRNLGAPVRISPDIASRRFTGVIMLDKDRTLLPSKLGALLDVSVTHEFNGWRLSSRVRDNR